MQVGSGVVFPSMSGDYVLGSHADELARLEAQSAAIEQPTRLVLQAAGIGSGMNVLDLGSGLGHVSQLVASLVGPEGSVVGVEQSPELLEAAERRRTDAGLDRVSFVQGDVRAFDAGRTFDAVVGRLILFHLADPVAVVRHHLGTLRPGGTVAMVDFDIGAARVEPRVPAADVIPWIEAAFSAAGAHPRIGTRLARILEEAGLERSSRTDSSGITDRVTRAGRVWSPVSSVRWRRRWCRTGSQRRRSSTFPPSSSASTIS